MSSQYILVTAFIPFGSTALVMRRSATDDFLPGYWEQVGGKLEFGETPEKGLAREVLEEAGLVVKPTKPYFVFSEVLDDGRHAIEIAYTCELLGKPEAKLSHEHQDMRWITVDEIASLDPLSVLMRKVLEEGFKTI